VGRHEKNDESDVHLPLLGVFQLRGVKKHEKTLKKSIGAHETKMAFSPSLFFARFFSSFFLAFLGVS
jgi:hypothetical protein